MRIEKKEEKKKMRKLRTLGIWGLLFAVVLVGLGLLGIASTGPGGAVGMIAFAWTPTLCGIVAGRKYFKWEGLENIPEKDRKGEIIKVANKSFRKHSARPILTGAGGQKVTGTDPVLTGVAPVILVTVTTTPTPDRGYELIYRAVNMRASTSKTVEILNVSGGVTFFQHEEGMPAELSELPKGSKATFAMLRFSGGFPILDDWFRFNEYYKIDQLTGDTEDGYTLLELLDNTIDMNFDASDIQTINKACATIKNDLKAAKYKNVDTLASRFIIVCNEIHNHRIMKALSADWKNPNNNDDKVIYNIGAVVNTTHIPSTADYYYVIVPGMKNVMADWDDLNLRPPQRNELKLGADYVWTGAYNFAIAEKLQIRRCALS
jgi:hypothetical protein